MAKRFGRNQRRRLREALHLQQLSAESWKHLHLQASKELAFANDVIEDIRQALGEHYIGLPPQKLCSSVRELVPDGRGSFRMFNGDFDASMAVMRVDSSGDPLGPRAQMHVRVELYDHTVAYAISTNALFHGDERYIATCLSRSMAPLLLSEIRKAKTHG